MYGLAINWKPLQALTEALLDRGVLQVWCGVCVFVFVLCKGVCVCVLSKTSSIAVGPAVTSYTHGISR